MDYTSRVEVDLTAIEHNVGVLRECLCSGSPPAALCAVLKSDGYGMGAARIAKRLSILGVDMIGVFTPAQARQLVDSAIVTPILILMPVRSIERSDALYRAAWHQKLHFSIHDRENLHAMEQMADRLGMSLPVHLSIDSGMTRAGAAPELADELVRRIDSHRRLNLAGVYTHFACADSDAEATLRQDSVFESWITRNASCIPDDCLLHTANSFGTFRSTTLHNRMVRVGLALFGYCAEEFDNTDGFEHADRALALRPAIRWISHVIQVKDVARDTPVGYGATWKTDRDSTLGIVPVGYADGYALALSNRSSVGVEALDGHRLYVPVRGRVSMDQIVVDLTDVPRDEACVGLPVELVGADREAPNHLPNLAAGAGTITHELLLRIAPSVPRSYVALDEARLSDREAMRFTRAGG